MVLSANPHRGVVLLAVLVPLWTPATKAAIPIDADAVIAECRGKVAIVECLSENVVLHYRALIDLYVQLESKEGVRPDVSRRRHVAEYDAVVGPDGCLPSCGSSGLSTEQESDTRVAELLIRDLVAERNFYGSWPDTNGPDGGIFSRVPGSGRLVRACWALSDRMRTLAPDIATWGMRRTVHCLEYVYLDQAGILLAGDAPQLHVSRQIAAEFHGVILALMNGLHPICPERPCDLEYERRVLGLYAVYLDRALRHAMSVSARRR